jgi:hypothetical protein
MIKGKKQPENNIPPILTAKVNVVFADLNNFQIKAGKTVNLYALFPPGIVRKSKTVKYALDKGILVPSIGTNKEL